MRQPKAWDDPERIRLRDAVLAARIAAAVPWVWLRVRLLPLPRALRGLMPPPDRRGGRAARGARPVPAVEFDEIARVVRLTDLVLKRRVAFLRPSCMLRSLVLFRFLREAGVPVRLHFGAAREGDGLKGHSWLTLDGALFAEVTDPTPRFLTVYSFPDDQP